MHKYSIALVCDHFHTTGGIETHLKYLCGAFRDLGHKVIVITTSKADIRYNNVKIYNLDRIEIINGISMPYFLKTGSVLKKIFEENEINIVHCHQSISTLSLEALFIAKCLNIRTCFSEHSIFSLKSFLSIFLSVIIKHVLRDVDVITSVSKSAANNLSKRINVDEKRIKIVTNAINYNIFNQKNIIIKKGKNKNTKIFDPKKIFNSKLEKIVKYEEGIKLYKESKLVYSTSKIIICVVTRFEKRKGIILLIKVLKILFKKSDDFIVKIAGKGSQEFLIKDFISENNLKDKIFVFNDISHDNISDFYKSGHIFLNTSLTEAFCIAILEAYASGLFVISTNVGGVKEILPFEKIYFSEVCENNLVYLILNSKKKINEKSNLKRLKKKYSWKKVAKSYIRYYGRRNKKNKKNQKKRPRNFLEIVLFVVLNTIEFIFKLKL